MLTRATTAYEILLNKELDFYTKIDPLFAELIVLVQDLVFYSVGYELDFNEQREKYREYFLRYCELINEIKKEVLIYQSYIPNDIFTACSNVIGQMQMDLEYWKLTAKILFHAPYEEIDEAKSNEKSDRILKKIAYSEVLIKKRLTALSKLN